MGGRMDPGYFRAYRRRNHERLLAQERARRAAKPRRPRTPAERAAENAAARARRAALAPPDPIVIPDVYAADQHDLFDHARRIVGRLVKRDSRLSVYDDLFEELCGVAVLALVEGSSPINAVLAHRKREADWRRFAVTGSTSLAVRVALGEERYVD
jgi:hypothetical protein